MPAKEKWRVNEDSFLRPEAQAACAISQLSNDLYRKGKIVSIDAAEEIIVAYAENSKAIISGLLAALRKTVPPDHHREKGKCVVGYCSRCDIDAAIAKAEGTTV